MTPQDVPPSPEPQARAGVLPRRPLGYTERPRRPGRLLAGAVVAAAACFAAARWAPPLWRHARVLYWQHQCMEYAPPPDTPVIETRTAEAERLVASGKGYLASRNDGSLRGRNVRPFCAATLEAPTALVSLVPSMKGVGVAFLHRRLSPGGHARLVMVGCAAKTDPNDLGDYSSYIYAGGAAVPAGWFGGEPQWTWKTDWPLGNVCPSPDFSTSPPTAWPTFRLFAGQPDPSDESHFTIAFLFKGRRDPDWPYVKESLMSDAPDGQFQFAPQDLATLRDRLHSPGSFEAGQHG